MSSNKSTGGFKGMIATGLTLLLVISGVVGIAKVNNIDSAGDAYNFFKAWSDKIWECTEGQVAWNCKAPSNDKPSESGNSSSKEASRGEAKSASNSEESIRKLEAITIADAGDTTYSRSDWKHWTGSPCNTREEVLKEQGSDVKTDNECRSISGTWVDPYSNDTFTDSGELDIDHVIPLNYANSHGGSKWDAKKKEAFANDKSQLLAVSASENRKKSDKGPAEYMPPNKDYHCEYSKLWVDTASKYDLSIGEKDRKALEKALNRCDA